MRETAPPASMAVTPENLVLSKAFQSSGDVIADRRAGYARMLSDAGDHLAAADLMDQALELVPHWTAGWDLAGGYRDKGGDVAGAISAWRHLEALDDEGIFGADLKLAALGARPARTGTAQSYVEALFDQYAPQFEASLVGRLEYRVPDMLDDLLSAEMSRLGIANFDAAIDLGCGTGLMGERVRQKVRFLEGVDLSAAMIAETQRKGVYDSLDKAELVSFLHGRASAADLVTAADVFIYCGALEPVLASVVPAMRPGALLAFSLEEHDGPEPLFLRPSLRYAHGLEATRNALIEAGLEILRLEKAMLRRDRGAPINGLLIVARKPLDTLTPANDIAGEDGHVAA
jgi:predicted TPR repeat methyltransferase